MNKLDENQLLALAKLRSCIKAVHHLVSKTITAHHLDTLLLIATQPGLTRQDINKIMQPQSMSTTRRYVADLTKFSYDRNNEDSGRLPGYDLIYEVDDSKDSKKKHLFLSNKGLQVCEILANRVLKEALPGAYKKCD